MMGSSKEHYQQLNDSYSCMERLVAVSYNLHGLNQGLPGITEMINMLAPDVIMVQEHWLVPSNLTRLNEISIEYGFFGSSAMNSCLGAGPLYGRPYGGTAILYKKELLSALTNITSNDRFTVIKVCEWLLFCVYMPCVGTPNRQVLCTDILHEIEALIFSNPGCKYLIGGDLNANLDCQDSVSDIFNNFLFRNNFVRCDVLFPLSNNYTYVQESLGRMNSIDYFLISDCQSAIAYNILDLDVNLSDHLPILTICRCVLPVKYQSKSKPSPSAEIAHYRWDHAPLGQYYQHTLFLLQPVLDELKMLENSSGNGSLSIDLTEILYNKVINGLKISADLFIPKRKKNFYKFWWDAELDSLKLNAVSSCRLWKESGKPKHGPIFDIYHRDKLVYKKNN